MKKLIYSLFAVALMGFAACNPNGPEGTGSQSYVDYSRGKIKLLIPSSKNVEADADGVSISIKDVTNANVQFECRPGANVGSYRMDVIPLAMLYNTIVNEGLVGAPLEDVEDLIIKLLEESTSTNKVVFNEESLDNYYSQNFDWMSTEYRNGDILCDCDYVICVVPCYDEEGTDPNGVNLAWFKTSAPALVGDPDVRIDVSTSYRAFNAVHEPNDDCKYVAYWSYLTEQIDDYEDAVGERMLRDFIRCASPSYNVASISDLSYYIDFAQSADAKVSQTCVAVAMDKNGTPSDYVARKDFYLMEIPESPAAVYSIKPYKSAASIFWIQVDFKPTCKNCYYRWMSEEEAAKIQAYSEDNKKAYARDLVQYGWGVKNYNFSFDAEMNVPTGYEYTAIENQIVAYQPYEKYVIVSAGENFYGEVTGLQFSEPVVMKQRVVDNPSSCLVSNDEFKLTLDNVSRTGFRYNFNYTNPDEVAIYYFQIVSPVDPDARKENPEMCPPEDVDNASHEDWMKFFFDTYIVAEDGEKVLQVNTWDVEPSGHDALSMFGYEPDVEYVVAYCVEDMNGVVSQVRLERVRTTSINPGANPQAQVSAALKDGEWKFTFSANEDTGTLYYMTSSFGDENYEKLGLYALPVDAYNEFKTYNSFHDIWEENMLSLGLTTKSLQTYATEKVRTDNTVILALCQPVGKGADGKDVYGELQHVLIVDGQVKHLSDYRTKPE